MSSGSRDNANQCPLQDQSLLNKVTDVYISVFFDGTGNNMYEQLNKKRKLEKPINKLKFKSSSVLFSKSPNLFSSQAINDLKEYGMANYIEQRVQAERDVTISNEREKQNTKNDEIYGGWKYSNVAVLRSLVKKNEPPTNKDDTNKIGISYNLYIEGSGKHWDTESLHNRKEWLIGLGMGTGRTGVVGLVSKAVVFVREYLCSNIDKGMRKDINLHFAVFGFSRGSTCGRLFSSLVVKGKEGLDREPEFEQYLPKNNYFRDNRVSFLDDLGGDKTIDFLGIYDTVSSIGFLQKNDNDTNYGINNYQETPKDNDGNYIGCKQNENIGDQANQVSGGNQTKQAPPPKWYINSLHGSTFTESDVLEVDTPTGPIPSSKVVGTFLSDKFWGDAKWNFHRFNVHDYGLDPYKYHKNVKHTFHICAIDEFRENFALVDLGDDLEGCTEIYMPGCHSDIGGGYMYNDEIEEHTLRRVIGPKRFPTRMNYSKDPRNIIVSPSLSQHVLFNMGWLNETTRRHSTIQYENMSSMIGTVSVPVSVELEESTYKNPLKITNEKTEGRTTYINQEEDKIDFKHFSKEGYSNISLQMMKDKATETNELKSWGQFRPFKDAIIPTRFKINETDETDETIKKIFDKCKSAVKKDEGKRYWVIPDDEKDYRYLRTNYLHFTCTDELHQGADFGNAPNWFKNGNGYLLCRLVYRGKDGDFNLHNWTEETFKNDEKI